MRNYCAWRRNSKPCILTNGAHGEFGELGRQDNFLAEMGNDRDLASAMDDAALFNCDVTGFTVARSEPNRDRVHAETALPRQKTNIEMAIERRQQLQATQPAGLTGSNQRQPPRAAAGVTPTGDQIGSAFPEIACPELDALRQEAGYINSGPDTPALASPIVDDTGFRADAAQPVVEPAPGARSSNAKTLAAAAIVLLIGTSIGYIASKSAEPTGAGTIESSGDGLKLRLDRDLRQR